MRPDVRVDWFLRRRERVTENSKLSLSMQTLRTPLQPIDGSER